MFLKITAYIFMICGFLFMLVGVGHLINVNDPYFPTSFFVAIAFLVTGSASLITSIIMFRRADSRAP